MKIIFDKLETKADIISVSFDNGNTYREYDVSDVKENGISFTESECPDMTGIKIKGLIETYGDIAAVKDITEEGIGYTGKKAITYKCYSDKGEAYLYYYDGSLYSTYAGEEATPYRASSVSEIKNLKTLEPFKSLKDIKIEFTDKNQMLPTTIAPDNSEELSNLFDRFEEGDLTDYIDDSTAKEYIKNITETVITENGEHIASEGNAYKVITVDVKGSLSVDSERTVMVDKLDHYYCYLSDTNANGIIDDEDHIERGSHMWLRDNKCVLDNVYSTINATTIEDKSNLTTDNLGRLVDSSMGSIYKSIHVSSANPDIIEIAYEVNGYKGIQQFIRNSEYDIFGEVIGQEPKLEHYSEAITEIIPLQTVSDTGLIVAPEGKAFKKVRVNLGLTAYSRNGSHYIFNMPITEPGTYNGIYVSSGTYMSYLSDRPITVTEANYNSIVIDGTEFVHMIY